MEGFLFELKNIRKQYDDRVVLDELSFKVKENEFISIMGPSGCGKSTLLNVLGLLDEFQGEYYINSKKIHKSDYAQIRSRYIGFVFQLYYLLPNLSVKENILIPTLYASNDSRNNAMKILDEVVEKLKIEDLLEKKVDLLSGGEKQRVAIARAMILQPYILIADEPTGALDSKNTNDVIGCFEQYVKEGHSVIMVTHSEEIARRATRQLVLDKGKLNEKE